MTALTVFLSEFHVVAANHVHTLIGKFLTCSCMRLKFYVQDKS